MWYSVLVCENVENFKCSSISRFPQNHCSQNKYDAKKVFYFPLFSVGLSMLSFLFKIWLLKIVMYYLHPDVTLSSILMIGDIGCQKKMTLPLLIRFILLFSVYQNVCKYAIYMGFMYNQMHCSDEIKTLAVIIHCSVLLYWHYVIHASDCFTWWACTQFSWH